MKKTNTFRISNFLEPIIIYDWETLEKVKYLVDKHPIECQWFHRIDRLEKGKLIAYYLHDLFIPPQYVSGGEVDSDGLMVGEGWKLFQEERGLSLQELGEVMSNTAVWCHSHHNMGAYPSGPDNVQWKKQLKLSKDGNQDCPQGMLIFNKDEKYFSRFYDPELELEFENLEIHVNKNVDFSDIDKAIKERFKRPPVKTTFPKRPEPPKGLIDWDPDVLDQIVFPYAVPPVETNTSPSSEKPQTGESSSDDDDEFWGFDPAWSRELIETIEALNRATGYDKNSELVKKLITILDIEVDTKDYKALATLLFGEPSAIRGMVSWFFNTTTTEEDDQGLQHFTEEVMAYTIDPSGLILEAIDYLNAMLEAKDTNELMVLIRQWIELTVDTTEEKPTNGHTTYASGNGA